MKKLLILLILAGLNAPAVERPRKPTRSKWVKVAYIAAAAGTAVAVQSFRASQRPPRPGFVALPVPQPSGVTITAGPSSFGCSGCVPGPVWVGGKRP